MLKRFSLFSLLFFFSFLGFDHYVYQESGDLEWRVSHISREIYTNLFLRLLSLFFFFFPLFFSFLFFFYFLFFFSFLFFLSFLDLHHFTKAVSQNLKKRVASRVLNEIFRSSSLTSPSLSSQSVPPPSLSSQSDPLPSPYSFIFYIFFLLLLLFGSLSLALPTLFVLPLVLVSTFPPISLHFPLSFPPPSSSYFTSLPLWLWR